MTDLMVDIDADDVECCARCGDGPIIVGDRYGNGGVIIAGELLCFHCYMTPPRSEIGAAPMRDDDVRAHRRWAGSRSWAVTTFEDAYGLEPSDIPESYALIDPDADDGPIAEFAIEADARAVAAILNHFGAPWRGILAARNDAATSDRSTPEL